LAELRAKLLAHTTEEIADETVPGNVRRIALPTYPFERRRYWLEDSHPLLGRRLDQQAQLPNTWTWEQRIEGRSADWLSGHRVMGSTVLPYSAYIEMALSAALQAGVASCSKVEDLTLHAPLILRAGESPTVQTVLSRENGGHLSFAVYHRTPAAKWRICASARIH
jgi:acyl transferase domain-containing protein